MKECKIRIVSVQDAEAILKIYAPYVEKTAITFEYEVPTVAEFENRISRILERYPYLAAERDGILMWALAGLHRLIEQNYQFTETEAAVRSLYSYYEQKKNLINRELLLQDK